MSVSRYWRYVGIAQRVQRFARRAGVLERQAVAALDDCRCGASVPGACRPPASLRSGCGEEAPHFVVLGDREDDRQRRVALAYVEADRLAERRLGAR